jgi:hypothetical protein
MPHISFAYETLEIEITWRNDGRGKLDLFLFDARWSTLKKVILDFSLFRCDDHCNKLEYKDFILSSVNVFFPMFKTLTNRQCTLETYVKFNDSLIETIAIDSPFLSLQVPFFHPFFVRDLNCRDVFCLGYQKDTD